jgi:polysaccharide export outer membrane protein
MLNSKIIVLSLAAILLAPLVGCSSPSGSQLLPETPTNKANNYLVGAGDHLRIFVWRNPDLSSNVTVRPDGHISSPLIDDLDVSGIQAVDIAELIENKLSKYIRTPQVTVMVSGFNSTVEQQIRVIGKAINPKKIPYRVGMTLLDVMIEVQGLSEFADGDNAQLIRREGGKSIQYRVELDSLIRGGDITKNRSVMPGDTIIIPESWF